MTIVNTTWLNWELALGCEGVTFPPSLSQYVSWHCQCTHCSPQDTCAGRCDGGPKKQGQLYISEKYFFFVMGEVDSFSWPSIVVQCVPAKAWRLASLQMAQSHWCCLYTWAWKHSNKKDNYIIQSSWVMNACITPNLWPEKMSQGVFVLLMDSKWLTRKECCLEVFWKSCSVLIITTWMQPKSNPYL